MELLTKKLFEQWMETILERLERQDEMLLALKAPEKREHTVPAAPDKQTVTATLPQHGSLALQDTGQEDLLQRR